MLIGNIFSVPSVTKDQRLRLADDFYEKLRTNERMRTNQQTNPTLTTKANHHADKTAQLRHLSLTHVLSSVNDGAQIQRAAQQQQKTTTTDDDHNNSDGTGTRARKRPGKAASTQADTNTHALHPSPVKKTTHSTATPGQERAANNRKRTPTDVTPACAVHARSTDPAAFCSRA